MTARALPGGVVSKESYDFMVLQILELTKQTLPLDGLFFDIETDNLILRCESIDASIKILDNIKQYNNLILRKILYTKKDSSVHLYVTALRS